MNHNLAIETHAAERYVLGELTNAERDAYEEHMFNCSACAEEVKCASELGDGLRMAFEEHPGLGKYIQEERPSLWKRILQPVPITAFAIALLSTGFSGYQTLAMHELKAATMAQLVTAVPSLEQSRDGGDPVVGVEKGKPFRLEYYPEKSDFYEIKVSTSSGSTKFFKKASAEDVGEHIIIFFPAESLEPGDYVFALRGIKGGVEGKEHHIAFKLEWKK